MLHSAQGKRDAPCRYHSVVFHPRLIGGGIDSVFWQSYLRPLIGSGLKSAALDRGEPWHDEALSHIERAWQFGASDAPGHEFRVRAALSELVLLLVGHLPSAAERVSEKAQRDGERIKLMLRFIQQNIDGELTVAEIAARAAISESECLRCFHDTIGIAPKQYVKRYRIQKAAELLTSTDGKIADIGARCGFLDTSYFTRAFHEVKGMTPGEFRQSYNGKWRVENGE